MSNKEMFLKGIPFVYDGFAFMYTQPINPSSNGNIMFCGNYNKVANEVFYNRPYSICGIQEVNELGFVFFNYIFNNKITGEVQFADCVFQQMFIPVQPPNHGTSTGSLMGGYHWFTTILATFKHIGEFLEEETPADDVLRTWGHNLYIRSEELIYWFNAFRPDKYIARYEIEDIQLKLKKRKSQLEEISKGAQVALSLISEDFTNGGTVVMSELYAALNHLKQLADGREAQP